MFGRRKVAMVVAEYLGTGILALVILSVQRSTIGIPYFVALAAGLALGALSLTLSAISGAHLNPAITLGLWSARKVRTLPAVSYVAAQLLGGWTAYGVYTYFINSSLQKISGHYTTRVMIAEAVGAFIFALIWAAVAAQRLSASIVGAGLALGSIVAASASLGVINPAVAIAERAWVVIGSTGWLTYALGPVLGAVVAFNLYQLLFASPSPVATLAAGSVSKSAETVAPVEVKPAASRKRSTARKPAAKKTTRTTTRRRS